MDYLIEFLYAKFLESTGICTDTRSLVKDNLFFALRGENFNGNQYAAKALELGAKFAVVDDPEYFIEGQTVLVEDSLKALQDLASFHRTHLRCPVLAITGSNGKTTTKELIKGVLEQKYIVACTKGNLNNHIGVPLTILAINPQHEVAIVEMGASAVGEIALLCRIADPTMGLITNIGKAHTETFGGIEGVIRGKSELFDYMRRVGGTVFINEMDPVLSNMSKRFTDPQTFPPQDVSYLQSNPFIHYSYSDSDVQTQLIGKYNFTNIAAAIAVGRNLTVPEEEIHLAIANYVPDNNRSEVIRLNDSVLIKDAYNANPDSMKAALEHLASGVQGKKVIILGDMNELENPAAEHRALGELVASMNFHQVFFCGEMMSHAHDAVEKSHYFKDTVDLLEVIEKIDVVETQILLKASRGMHFEKISDALSSQSNKKQ